MPLGCALRGGELVRGTPASQAARRQGPGPGLDVSRGHCAGRPRPRGRGGAPQSVWASQRPHEADAVAPLLPIWEVEPRAQEAQSGCGPDVRTPGACALCPAEDTRAATAEADLRYRRPGSSPAGARGRPRCGRTGREGTAERERAPFTGPFPERRCRPPGTRQPGLAAGRPGPFLRGTQCWLHKGPTPVWTCGADARTCYRGSWPSVQRTCSRHTEPTVSSAQATSPRETARS